MDSGNHLKTLLQYQLASDASSIRHLPFCLSSLTEVSLLPSPHLTKWTTRINALLHSKEAGARWAGFCLAYKTALLSQNIMIDSAQGWIASAMPVLSRNEPVPTLKASIRLLRVIFTTATDMPEFQRQVAVPNVIKFTTTITSLAENHHDVGLKIFITETLTRLVVLYPTTHRASQASLSAFALQYLSGSTIGPQNFEIVSSAARLYASLPLTGGKVGAINLWRKSLDESLVFGWEAFHSLRTTFPVDGLRGKYSNSDGDPQVAIPLNLDKLRSAVATLRSLLSAPVQRPVHVPLGNIVKFITALITCSGEGKIDGFIDPLARSMELAVVPEVYTAGSDLLAYLAEQFPFRLNAHLSELSARLAYQLEQRSDVQHQLSILRAICMLHKNSYPVDSSILLTRIAKPILPTIAKLIPTTSQRASGPSELPSTKSKNGKKRGRNFEGDEVFKATQGVVCLASGDEELLMVSIDVLEILFKNINSSSAMKSMIARVVISIVISLPRMSPSFISRDPNFIQVLYSRVQHFAVLIASGTTNAMSKALPFVVEATSSSSWSELHSTVELLLHPRVPPLVRAMPHLESLSLFRAEESHEETELLSSLAIQGQEKNVEEDVAMKDNTAACVTSTYQPVQPPDAVTKQPSQFSTIRPTGILSQSLLPVPAPAPPSPPVIEESPSPQTGPPQSAAFQPIPVGFPTPLGPSASSSESTRSATVDIPMPLLPSEEYGDEEMPSIDMDSDSEVEEE